MAKMNFKKGIAWSILGVTLVSSLADVTPVLAATASANLEYTTQDSDTVKNWTYKVNQTEGAEVAYEVYDDDKKNPEIGEWNDVKTTDNQDKGYCINTTSDDEITIKANHSNLKPGTTYTVDIISYDTEKMAADEKARDDAAKAKAREAAVAKYEADCKAYAEGTISSNQSNYSTETVDGKTGYAVDLGYKKYYYYDYNGNYNYFDVEETYKADYATLISSTKITIPTPEVNVDSAVTESSVQLMFGARTKVTGYEVYKKINKKYVKIATTTEAAYLDEGLTKDTEYQYKVVPYYVDRDTNATIRGAANTITALTTGSALALNATPYGKKLNTVKLTWTKVKGATAYNVYRYNAYSFATSVKKGTGNSFRSKKLLKTLKAKKKAYVDKTTTAGESYTYIVEAVMADGSVSVDDSAYVSLDFESIDYTYYDKLDGSKVCTWNKVPGATAYKIYRKDVTYTAYANITDWEDYSSTEVWTEVASVKKPTYTFPGISYDVVENNTASPRTNDYVTYDDEKDEWKNDYSGYVNAYVAYMKAEDNDSEEYKIVAVNKNGNVSSGRSIYMYPVVPTATSAKAVATTNGIQVSWTPVDGASYYEVIRSKSGLNIKDTTNKTVSKRNYDSETVTVYNDVVDLQQVPTTDGSVKYYRNYSSKNEIIPASTTSIVDYSGKISDGDLQLTPTKLVGKDNSTDTTTTERTVGYTYVDNGADASTVKNVGPQAGVEYQYSVVAYFAKDFGEANYRGSTTEKYYADGLTLKEDGTFDWSNYKRRYAYYDANGNKVDFALDDNGNKTTDAKGNYTVTYSYAKYDTTAHTYTWGSTPVSVVSTYEGYDYSNAENTSINTKTLGCTTEVAAYGKATFTSAVAAKKAPAVKKIEASKKGVVVTLKKTAKKAKVDEYKIYRSNKKKGKYTVVGVTTKNKFVDKTAKDAGNYFYKVVSVKANEAGADVESKATKVKKVVVK